MFIKLSIQSGEGFHYVNIDHVCKFERVIITNNKDQSNLETTLVRPVTNLVNPFYVKETPEEIMKLIEEVRKCGAI